MSNNAKKHRLFFALWPSDQTRQLIVDTFSQLPKAIPGRVIQLHNLHMTLHFAGSVTEDVKACMHAAAETVGADAFVCKLDCYGYFPRARIFWMGCQDTPAELMDLHNELGAAIEICGYRAEKRIFTPHITLQRNCMQAGPLQADFSLQWPVDEFALVESHSDTHGVNYQVIETYPLSSDDP